MPAVDSQSTAPSESTAAPDDAFGAQFLLKETPRIKPVTVTLEVSPQYTSNVALSQRDPLGDTFLAAICGVGWRRAISPTLSLDADLRGTIYRYDRYRALDFQSLVAASQLTYTPRRLRNTSLYAFYSFTQLTERDFGDAFFDQHAVGAGIQRTFPISQAHGFSVGASAMWTWTDPAATKRDEYSLFLAYRAALTRRVSLNAAYRAALYVYPDAAVERNDLNHALSLGIRYDFNEWSHLNIGASATFNRSDEAVFDYDVWNIGGTLGVRMSF